MPVACAAVLACTSSAQTGHRHRPHRPPHEAPTIRGRRWRWGGGGGRWGRRRRDGDEDRDVGGFPGRVRGEHGELVGLGFLSLRAYRALPRRPCCRVCTGRHPLWAHRDLAAEPVDIETGRSRFRFVQGVGERVTRVLGPHRCTDVTPRSCVGSNNEGGRGPGKCRGSVIDPRLSYRIGRNDRRDALVGPGPVGVRRCDPQVRASRRQSPAYSWRRASP